MLQTLAQYWNNFRTGLSRLYLNDRLFIGLGSLIVLAVLAYAFPWLLFLPIIGLAGLLGALGFDIWQLYNRRLRIGVHRRLPKVLSLSDEMTVSIEIGNLSPIPLSAIIIDELPVQLQRRDLEITASLKPKQRKSLKYRIRPTERGAYLFGDINVFLQTALGLVQRRFIIAQSAELPVYPSIIQMKEYELKAFSTSVPAPGMRKMRRLGKSYEFDQIKNYVRGDDYRSINWRATGRRNELMVNQYEDERSQQIYCIIDKSRSMLMPFKELSLLDYAINASLALSNVILKKHDRAGLITFSDKVGTVLRADSKSTQLQAILQALYREKERETENNPELLYYATRKFISGRSLLLLFSNYESEYALDRALPMLRRIHANHLLVVILFENTEIRESSEERANNIGEIYHQSTARYFIYEKQMLAQRLRQYGIQVILTKPEELTVNAINKYLELKKRGMI
ncbi:MAG: DUF58 domain-containing protein [Bacteroidota bacterium]